MVRFLTRTGLLITVVAVGALIVVETEMGSAHQLFLRSALLLGAGMWCAGAVLWVLGKLLNTQYVRRCPKCRRPVPRGHVYCEDHFREALFQAKDQNPHR